MQKRRRNPLNILKSAAKRNPAQRGDPRWVAAIRQARHKMKRRRRFLAHNRTAHAYVKLMLDAGDFTAAMDHLLKATIRMHADITRIWHLPSVGVSEGSNYAVARTV